MGSAGVGSGTVGSCGSATAAAEPHARLFSDWDKGISTFVLHNLYRVFIRKAEACTRMYGSVPVTSLCRLWNGFCHCPQTLLKRVLMSCRKHIWHPEMESFLFGDFSRNSGNSSWQFYAESSSVPCFTFCCVFRVYLLSLFSNSVCFFFFFYLLLQLSTVYLSSSFVYYSICALASLSSLPTRI